MISRKRKTYFVAFIVFLLIEISIALFVENHFIRGTLGDFLVVFLIYFFFQWIFLSKPFYLAAFTMVFAFLVEFLQYFNLVEVLGLQQNLLASTVLGTTFSLHDLIAYGLGTICVYWLDKKIFYSHTPGRL